MNLQNCNVTTPVFRSDNIALPIALAAGPPIADTPLRATVLPSTRSGRWMRFRPIKRRQLARQRQ